MKIRLETPQDYLEVEEMVRDSFWNVYRPGAFEHYIVHRLRQDESLISNLAYVIELNEKIIAHINYCEGKLDFQNKKSVNAAILGPIAVKNARSLIIASVVILM